MKKVIDLPKLLQDILKDQNKNGIPDTADKVLKEMNMGESFSTNQGKSKEELPSELRSKIDLQKLIPILGGPTGWIIAKFIKLAFSSSKTSLSQSQKKESHEITQIESTRPNPIKINQPNLGEIPSEKDHDKFRSLIFVIIILGIIGWFVYSYINTGL